MNYQKVHFLIGVIEKNKGEYEIYVLSKMR